MRHKVAIIVLNYRHPEDTINCVKILLRSDIPSDALIVCVDNSPLHSASRLREALPQVHLIKSKKNLGFAAGNNLGIKFALAKEASHILIINPDVKVGKKFIKPLISIFSKDPNIGLVAPAIKHLQNNQVFYGLEGSLDWRFAIAKHINLEKLPPPSLRPAQFITFACILIKAEVCKKVGLLDEKYFMYLEDVDYSLQATKAGYKIFLDPSVVVDHRTSSSFKKPTDKLIISFKSQIHFINRWRPFPNNLFPLFYAVLFYPYLYLLWTYFDIKKKLVHQG